MNYQSSHVPQALSGFSVGRKLLLAFGLIALLAMAVAATGFQAIHALLARQQLMADMAQINSLVLQARSAERDYANAQLPESAEQLRQAIAGIEEVLQGLGAAQALPATQLDAMARSRQAYLQQFNDFAEQLLSAGRARTRLQARAAETMQRFELVEMDVYDLMRALLEEPVANTRSPLALAESTGEIMRLMQGVRASEWQYLLQGNDRPHGQWQQQMSDVDALLQDLMSRLPATQQAILDQAGQSLQAYRGAFSDYRRSVLSSQSSDQTMQVQADDLLHSASQASAALGLLQAEERRQVQFWLGAISALVLLLSLVAGLMIRRQIVTPLQEALALAQGIAQGDLRLRPFSQRSDEFGQLLDAMHHMSASLRELVMGIDANVQQLGEAAGALTGLSEQTRTGVLRQHRETEQTATAMQQMAASVQEVASTSEQASVATRQAEQEALSGSRLVQQTATQVAHLADNMDGSAQAVEQLHQASRHIDSVLEVINAIAAQTNLLALNAAIEAARAGEQGRGFAVVADEVRALARRTQESTAQIEQLIGGLQQGAQQAVMQIQTSRDLTRDSVTLSEQALVSLQRITQVMSEIEGGSQQTAAATQQQSAVAEMISQSITEVRDIAEQSANASGRMVSASADLAGLGQRLQGLVARFRI